MTNTQREAIKNAIRLAMNAEDPTIADDLIAAFPHIALEVDPTIADCLWQDSDDPILRAAWDNYTKGISA